MKGKIKLRNRILSILLSIALIVSCLPLSVFLASAEEGYVYKGGAGNKISDLDTSGKYSESLGDNASTEYAGRVWTDKSVYTDDVSFATYGGGTSVIKLNENGTLGEDFLVAYSALATAESVSGQTKAPIDVVLIIDISGSMSNNDSNMDNGKSRIYNTVQAVNTAIDKLMALNEYTRVAVVAFSNNAEVLLPLDRYTHDTAIERVWVQTGYFQWQGYWEEVETEVPYFTVSPDEASNNYATLTTLAYNSNNTKIEKTTSVQGGTNIQMGLYEGMQILANEKDITATIGGKEIQRVPSVILLSDGSPTYSSNSTSWWAPADNNNDGPGSSPYAGNGMKAILVGSYMKDAIDRNYNVAGTAYSTTVYTVGMGITGLSDNEKNLAYMTLDPGTYWNNANVTNSMKTTIKGYWDSYTANGNTGTLNINVGRLQNNRYYDKNYSLTHPTTGYDVDPENGYDYVDGYYGADNASAVTDVFNQIVTNISITAPQIPTELKGSEPISDGYITYTDPIGEYMEVKDVKAIIYAGETFRAKNKTVNGNTTEFVFSGEVHSPVYGNQEIKHILISVVEAGGKQTLTVKIPAAVIPIRVNEVILNADGTVKQHTNNGAFPARVIYSVGLKSEILKESDSGVVYLDSSKISSDYLAANTNADGTVNFYTNIYNGTNVVNGSTAGNATVEFEPSHSSNFYYILQDMPIYTDASYTNQVTAEDGIDDDKVYYYHDEYYHGTQLVGNAVARTGAQLKKTEIKTGDDGFLYRAAGSPRLNRILKFEGTKIANATNTAEDFYAPTFHYAEGSTDAYDGKFVVYQGNNGVLSLVAGGNLEITKTVNAAQGLTAPDKTFEFTLNLDGDEVNSKEYTYIITDASGATVGSGVVSAQNNKVYLKNGQKATVFSLSPGTHYEVKETAVEGFTGEAQGAVGYISANNTSTASFINTYNVTSVKFPTSGELSGEKQLVGRAWDNNDSFTFFISPYNNAPLPENYDSTLGVTVTAPDVAGGDTASFDFGTIEFNAPGVYRYTITEKEPENDNYLPGISYSRALYRLVVAVEDNGDGTLKVASYDVQRLYDDAANQLFTYDSNNQIVMNNGEEAQDSIKFVNTYSAESVIRVPVALKDYTDNSGTNPLVSGMFNFKLEAVGYIVNGGGLITDVSKVPMPNGSVNGSIMTTNEGHNITFPSVEFTHEHIPAGSNSITFRYNLSEVIPDNPVNGMTYDTNVFTVDVVVSIDASDDTLNVSAIYPDGVNIATFVNSYTPFSVKTDINGTKTLIGRDMKQGEAFEFALSGANAATNNAVRQGDVVIPSDKADVTNGKDGEAVAFAFSDIEFKKAGTYLFSVSEVRGNAPSVSYDGTTVNVTVVIADLDFDGNLDVVSVTYDNSKQTAEFVNTYTTEFEGTPVSLRGTKNLTGKSLLDGEFFFDVIAYYNNTFVSEGLVSHTKDTEPDANGVYTGSISFLENVTYDKAGIYTYYISEQIPDPKVGGTEYDETKYIFTVTVEDVDKVGKLTVTSKSLKKSNGVSTEDVSEIVFNNKYKPAPTTAKVPLIKKVISGHRADGLKDNEFKFSLSLVSADPAGGITLPLITEVFNKANGDVIFDDITFSEAGTYSVKIKEIIPDDGKVAGITYSTQEIIATFGVTDDRNGGLTAVLLSYVGDNAIINSYTADPAEVEVNIKKNFTGRDNDEWLSTDKFDFEVVVLDPATQKSIENGEIEFPMDNGNSEIAHKTIDKNTLNKTISGKIKVNYPGTYKFIVREIAGNISGVHYDSQPREITIIATDISQNAKIDVKYKLNGVDVDNLELVFNNVYNTSSTELSGHDDLVVTKNFTGRPNDNWLDSDVFKFKLEAHGAATVDAVNNGDVVMPASLELNVSNANKAHAHFGNIIFNKKGEYEFKITEIDTGAKGVIYDSDKDRIIKVSVVDDNQGALVAEIADGSEDLIFNNTYTVQDAVLEGASALKIVKSLVGRNWFANDSFSFTIRPFDVYTIKAVNETGDVVLPSPATVSAKAPSADYYGDVAVHFGDITFKKAGIYVFAINEIGADDKNIEYDTHTYYVEVTVVDNNEGQLVASTRYSNTDVFVNTYTPDPVSVKLSGEKELEGRNLKADEFKFKLTAVNSGTPMPTKSTVSNDANGNIKFPAISFSQEGTYVYEITEVTESIPGITYDKVKTTVTVTVTYDRATGELSADVLYAKNGSADSTEGFKFKNTYKPDASEPISLKAQKNVTASEGNSYTIKGGEFSFVIEGETGSPMPTKNTASNDANGVVDFGSVSFTKAGTYKYVIREVQGTQGHFTYDGEVYTVTVTVTDDTDAAKLKTSVEITNSKGNVKPEATFNNKYTPKETSAVIFGKKTLQSEHKNIEEGEFEFVIEAVTKNAPLPKNTTVKNTAAGSFQFDTIKYSKVGTYVYKITEKNLGKHGYTYDDKEYTVTVTVTDAGSGELSAKIDGVGTVSDPTIKFVNGYTPDGTSVTIGADGELKKNLDGRDIKADEFIFAVLDGNKELATDKNNKNGEFEFTLEFEKSGTYNYTIIEKKNDVPGVTYDESVYNVQIKVIDNNGKLKVESVVYTLESNVVNKVVFNNSYKPDASEPVSLKAQKNVTASEGNSYTIKGGEFSFVIEGETGSPMPTKNTASNDASGVVDFGSVSFTKAGTYKYVIREVQGTQGHFTYDGEVYTVTVTVTDDTDAAKLKTSVEITNSKGSVKSEAAFNNKYTPKETSAVIFGKKTLQSEHKNIEEGEFEFVIEAVTKNAPLPKNTTVKNTAAGSFQFDTIKYSKVGTYVYKITEKDLGKHGYTYDDKEYTVTVTVTDAGSGELSAKIDGVGTVSDPTIKFVNGYTPDGTSVTIGADGELKKKLDGRDIKADEFIFAVLDGNKELATDKNNKNGEFEFTLEFEKAGTYNYTIIEKKNDVPGVTYDESVYNVQIKVIDNNGKLKVESVVYTLENDKVDEVVFNNTYVASPAEFFVQAKKILNGRPLNNGEFSFAIKDSKGNVVATAVNTDSGLIDFGKLMFTQAGSYAFTIVEEMGTLEHITYDSTKHQFTIKVIDNGLGQLVIDDVSVLSQADDIRIAFRKGSEYLGIQGFVFENTYKEPTPPPVVPGSPQTGVNNIVWMMFALLFVSSGSMIGAVAYRKKKTSSKES